MAEAEARDDRKRSPNYPSISLQAAVAKIGLIYPTIKIASGTKETLAGLWETTAKSSSFLQTLGSLGKYGLLQTIPGTPKKFKLTRDALDIVMLPYLDPRHSAALKRAALAPKIFRSIWDDHGSDFVSDTDLKHLLVTTHQFLPDAATDAIKQYRANIEFAKLVKDDKIDESGDGSDAGPKVGDLVQWESGGVAQFQEPRPVASKSPDGLFVFVEGSSGCGMPVEEVKVVEPGSVRVTQVANTVTKSSESVTPTLPKSPPANVQSATIKQDVFTSETGDVIARWPTTILAADKKDLLVWLERIKRRIIESVSDNQSQ